MRGSERERKREREEERGREREREGNGREKGRERERRLIWIAYCSAAKSKLRAQNVNHIINTIFKR